MAAFGIIALIIVAVVAYVIYGRTHRTPRDRELRRDPSSRPSP